MGKHAYLLLVHDDIYNLKTLIELIDDIRNDIYIHIDKKCSTISEGEIKNIAEKSNVFFVENRIDVKWGGSSLILAELELFKVAINRYYDYYHLLSGADLPIKSQDYIHKFFDENNGKEFIGFNNIDKERKKVKYYYFFQEKAPRKVNRKDLKARLNNSLHIFYRCLDRVIILGEKLLGVNRIDKGEIICRGSNWVSVTYDLLKEIVNNADDFAKKYKYTAYSDEIFIQTFVYNSRYIDKVYSLKDEYESCRRNIDWKRGWPYVFTIEDKEELLNSDMIFARKFNSLKDREIIDDIKKEILKLERT